MHIPSPRLAVVTCSAAWDPAPTAVSLSTRPWSPTPTSGTRRRRAPRGAGGGGRSLSCWGPRRKARAGLETPIARHAPAGQCHAHRPDDLPAEGRASRAGSVGFANTDSSSAQKARWSVRSREAWTSHGRVAAPTSATSAVHVERSPPPGSACMAASATWRSWAMGIVLPRGWPRSSGSSPRFVTVQRARARVRACLRTHPIRRLRISTRPRQRRASVATHLAGRARNSNGVERAPALRRHADPGYRPGEVGTRGASGRCVPRVCPAIR